MPVRSAVSKPRRASTPCLGHRRREPGRCVKGGYDVACERFVTPRPVGSLGIRCLRRSWERDASGNQVSSYFLAVTSTSSLGE
jgi:hypothetical protein